MPSVRQLPKASSSSRPESSKTRRICPSGRSTRRTWPSFFARVSALRITASPVESMNSSSLRSSTSRLSHALPSPRSRRAVGVASRRRASDGSGARLVARGTLGADRALSSRRCRSAAGSELRPLRSRSRASCWSRPGLPPPHPMSTPIAGARLRPKIANSDPGSARKPCRHSAIRHGAGSSSSSTRSSPPTGCRS